MKPTEPGTPPSWLDALLRRIVAPHLREEVMGDLHERYQRRVRRLGERAARKTYWREALAYLRPAFIKRQPSDHPTPSPTDMLQNYLKIALRNLRRYKAYTFLNGTGLALGMCCGILVFTLVRHHLSFDTFHPQIDRVYRIVTEQHRETVSYTTGVPSPLGKVFREDYSYAEKVARIANFDEIQLSVTKGTDVTRFREEEGISFAEPAFFDIFRFPLVAGDPRTVLTEPNTAILTERMARKYFGTANPINKTLRLDNKVDFRITGVLKDFPTNTDQKAELYASYSTLKQYDPWLGSDDSWGGTNSSMQCFVRLRPGVAPQQVESVLPAYVRKYRANSKSVHHYKLQPLSDMHYNPRYGGEMSRTNLWVLSLIGLFLIITACVNFINLATAQALNRSKEVGVRKVLGGFRGQIFWQFISETGLITFVAIGLALAGAVALLPFVNEWFRSRMTIDPLHDGPLVLFLVLLLLFVTFFAGSYPGLILARFQPVRVLRGGRLNQSIGGFNVRRGLIVIQFAISQLLIVGVIVIASQMRYASQADLGFRKEAVVMVPVATGSTLPVQQTLKEQFLQLPGIEQVSLCYTAPASNSNWNTMPQYDNRSEPESFAVNVRAADHQYVPLFELPLVAGRNLLPSDTVREFLVNETFARKLNLKSPREVLGKSLGLSGDEMKGTIVGVVKDFHDRSFRQEISPTCLTTLPSYYNAFAVRISGRTARQSLEALEKTWTARHPDQIFQFQFLDDQIREFYETEALLLNLIEALAAIAIFIGCLGLYGLVSFMAAQKAKEIGIRKVLGSSVGQIVWMFAGEFSRLIGLAFLVAGPLAYFAMQHWLTNFKYKISLGADVFGLAIAGTFFVAFLTVGYRSVKAALMNPVKSLRAD